MKWVAGILFLLSVFPLHADTFTCSSKTFVYPDGTEREVEMLEKATITLTGANEANLRIVFTSGEVLRKYLKNKDGTIYESGDFSVFAKEVSVGGDPLINVGFPSDEFTIRYTCFDLNLIQKSNEKVIPIGEWKFFKIVMGYNAGTAYSADSENKSGQQISVGCIFVAIATIEELNCMDCANYPISYKTNNMVSDVELSFETVDKISAIFIKEGYDDLVNALKYSNSITFKYNIPYRGISESATFSLKGSKNAIEKMELYCAAAGAR